MEICRFKESYIEENRMLIHEKDSKERYVGKYISIIEKSDY